MTCLTWTKKLSIGNAIIDSEHRNLISMANGIVDAIMARDRDEIAQAFELIESWMNAHYANEEAIALEVDFDYSKHKQAQRHELNELWFLRDELLGKNLLWSEHMVEHFSHFLKNLIIDDHIIRTNMQMKQALEAHGYHFWPEQHGGNGHGDGLVYAVQGGHRQCFNLAAGMQG